MTNRKGTQKTAPKSQPAKKPKSRRKSSNENARRKSRAASRRSDETVFIMHDTPPPLIVGDGSVFVESDEDLTMNGKVVIVGQKKRHQRAPRNQKRKAYIHAIRVLLGNGETDVDGYFHPIEDKEGCRIDIVLTGGSTIQMAGGDYFYVQTERNNRLMRTGSPAPKDKHRFHILTHIDASNAESGIESVTITDGENSYSKVLSTLPGHKAVEFQIMVWVEDVTP